MHSSHQSGSRHILQFTTSCCSKQELSVCCTIQHCSCSGYLPHHCALLVLLRHALMVALAAGGRHEHHWEQGQPPVPGWPGAYP